MKHRARKLEQKTLGDDRAARATWVTQTLLEQPFGQEIGYIGLFPVEIRYAEQASRLPLWQGTQVVLFICFPGMHISGRPSSRLRAHLVCVQ